MISLMDFGDPVALGLDAVVSLAESSRVKHTWTDFKTLKRKIAAQMLEALKHEKER